MNKCPMPDCNQYITKDGYCGKHYLRKWKYGDPTISKCNTNKTHCANNHEFSKENTYIDKNGWRLCKSCMKAKRKPFKNFSARQKETHYRISRKWNEDNRAWKNLCHVLRTYKLTLDQYHALLEQQDFHCAICDEKENLCVDHNHITGKVRGLLCFNHNIAIGHFNENVDIMKNGIGYLEKYTCQ